MSASRLKPPASSIQVSLRMSRAPSRDTGPEIALRRELHGAGYRYRVHYKAACLPRKTIDIAFPRVRLAIFVDGCFWHSCPLHGSLPKSNADWWATKLTSNVGRDRESDNLLHAAGWEVLRFWEHQAASEAFEIFTYVYAKARSPRARPHPLANAAGA